MGAFDAFVGDDDDQPAGGLIDLVAVLQGNCSNQRVVEVKAAYMRLKERKITLVDFLKLARDAVGEDAQKTLAASRLAAEPTPRARPRARPRKNKNPHPPPPRKKGKAARDGRLGGRGPERRRGERRGRRGERRRASSGARRRGGGGGRPRHRRRRHGG